MKQRARVAELPPPVNADHVVHRRIGLHDLMKCGQLLAHGRERDVLGGLDGPSAGPCPAAGRSPSDDDVQVHIQARWSQSVTSSVGWGWRSTQRRRAS